MKFKLFSALFGRQDEDDEEEIQEEIQKEDEVRKAEEYSGAATLPAFSQNVPVDVLTEDKQVLFSGRLAAFSRTELNIKRIPGTINFPILEVGLRVLVRGYNVDLEPYNLKASVTESNMVECKLQELELIPYENHRGSFRQPLNVPAAFYAMEDTYLYMPQECRVLDISTGGARVASSYQYAVGDVLRLRTELMRDSGYMSFTSKVVRVTETAGGGYEYGVLFAQLKQRQIHDLMNDIQRVQKETMRKLTD